MSDFETKATLLILIALCSIYIYLLVSPNQPHLPAHPINVVIQRDSLETFNKFMQEYKEYHYGYENYNYTDDKLENYNYTGSEWGSSGMHDDFFLDAEDPRESIEDFEPIVPSKNILCEDVYITIRSELNYKYLWVLGVEKHRMAATATMDTPLHHRSFHVIPVDPSCSNGGWVLLKETDSDKFIKLISPNRTTLDNNDAWVITLGSNDSSNAFSDNAYHFLIENEGYILNKDVMGFITIFPTDSDYPARGHSSNYFRRDKPAGREFGSSMRFQTINQSYIEASLTKEKEEILQAQREDEILLEKIHSFPSSREKRVISFGVYGSNPKYTSGALKNLELSKIYYEGWKCRFYVTSDVPEDILEKLRSGGAEIENIPSGMGYTSGMFWRFMIASDPSVDRYIIRDSDSRLNARERIAVQEWIESNYPIHILRDHVNHCISMNGGMWGGVKGAIDMMETKVREWNNRDVYSADLHFLADIIWPEVKYKQLAHDSYCCDRFPNTKPFPTKRNMLYQHVGQVFDENDEPRLSDIDGFIRGVPIPSSCRKESDWIYG